MKKIVIPIDAGGVLNTHFGHSPYFLIATVVDNNVEKKEVLPAPPHEPGLLPKWMEKLGVTHVLAGGVGQKAIDLFEERGIKVQIGAPKMDSNQLLVDFLNGNMEFSSNRCTH